MVQLGILTTEFERPSLDDTLDAISDHKIRAVQFQLGSALPAIPLQASLQRGLEVLGPHIDSQLCGEIREQLNKRDLVLAAVDGTFNMVGRDEDRRRTNLGYLLRLIESCETLGTSIVSLCTGSRDEIMWHRHRDNDSAEAWRDLVAITKQAAHVAEEYDVVLAFEPEMNNVVNSAERARRLIDDVGSPAVKVLMDAANIFGPGALGRMQDTLKQAFSLVGNDIALAHAKDLDHDNDAGHLAAGHGALDYPLYLSLLQKSRFDGIIVLHQLRGLSDTEIDSCFRYVREKAPPEFVR